MSENSAARSDGSTVDGLLALFDADLLRKRLIRAGAFLSAYELLKTFLIENPREFYGEGLGLDPDQAEYRAHVRALNKKDVFTASALWFHGRGALDDQDLVALAAVRDHRNRIAHELPGFLATPAEGADELPIDDVARVYRKLEVWWLREIEIPIDSRFDGEDPNELAAEAFSGAWLVLATLTDIASGRDEAAQYLHSALRAAASAAEDAAVGQPSSPAR